MIMPINNLSRIKSVIIMALVSQSVPPIFSVNFSAPPEGVRVIQKSINLISPPWRRGQGEGSQHL
jgi:hypothetical protein